MTYRVMLAKDVDDVNRNLQEIQKELDRLKRLIATGDAAFTGHAHTESDVTDLDHPHEDFLATEAGSTSRASHGWDADKNNGLRYISSDHWAAFAGGEDLMQVEDSPLAISIGVGSRPTNATSGFPWIPTMAGTPTGTPTAHRSGFAPIVIDSTNDKLYAYYGGAWHDLTGT